MTPQELIRKFVELLTDETPEESQVPTVTLTKVEVDNSDESDGETMISPLQQKLELLKKSVGVDSSFDNSKKSDIEDESDDSDDDLAFIKKAAGVMPVTSMTDSDGVEE